MTVMKSQYLSKAMPSDRATSMANANVSMPSAMAGSRTPVFHAAAQSALGPGYSNKNTINSMTSSRNTEFQQGSSY